MDVFNTGEIETEIFGLCILEIQTIKEVVEEKRILLLNKEGYCFVVLNLNTFFNKSRIKDPFESMFHNRPYPHKVFW